MPLKPDATAPTAAIWIILLKFRYCTMEMEVNKIMTLGIVILKFTLGIAIWKRQI